MVKGMTFEWEENLGKPSKIIKSNHSPALPGPRTNHVPKYHIHTLVGKLRILNSNEQANRSKKSHFSRSFFELGHWGQIFFPPDTSDFCSSPLVHLGKVLVYFYPVGIEGKITPKQKRNFYCIRDICSCLLKIHDKKSYSASN